MAEVFAASGDLPKALDYVTKAAELSPEFAAERAEAFIEVGYTAIPEMMLKKAHEKNPKLKKNDDHGTLTHVAMQIQAGLGMGRDAMLLDEEQRRALLDRAHRAFTVLMDGWQKDAGASFISRNRLKSTLEKVVSHPAFHAMADHIKKKKLSPEERRAWSALLRQVAQLRKKVE